MRDLAARHAWYCFIAALLPSAHSIYHTEFILLMDICVGLCGFFVNLFFPFCWDVKVWSVSLTALPTALSHTQANTSCIEWDEYIRFHTSFTQHSSGEWRGLKNSSLQGQPPSWPCDCLWGADEPKLQTDFGSHRCCCSNIETHTHTHTHTFNTSTLGEAPGTRVI